MDRFCLILVTLEAECKCHKDVVAVLQSLVKELLDSYCQTKESHEHVQFTEYELSDPVLALKNARSQIFFGIIEDKLFSNMTEFATKWHTGESLTEVLSLLAGVDQVEGIMPKGISDRDISERLHQLADSLPAQAGVPVDVFWFTCGRINLQIKSHLHLFGALKRLQHWHDASITVLCSDEFDRNTFLKPWQRSLNVSIAQLNSSETLRFFNPCVKWRGSLVFQEGNSNVKLSGFDLCCETSKTKAEFKENTSLCRKRKEHAVCDVRKDISIAPEITIHCKMAKSSVPFHIFVPMKLKLNLNSSSNKLSTGLVEWFSANCNRDIALVGSLLLVTSYRDCSKSKNKESWINFVKCQSDSVLNLDSKEKEEEPGSYPCERRLCLICSGAEKQLSLFVLRPPEHFNGRIQNELAVLHSTLRISSDQEIGGPLVFPDITDSFLETEQYFNKIHLVKIQHEMSKSLNGNFSSNSLPEVTDEMLSEKWTYLKALRENLKQTTKEHQLDVVKREVLLGHDTSELLLSPRKWPERACLQRNDPNALEENSGVDDAKENLPFLATASSLNVKDILDKFRSDGRPVRTDLTPMPPQDESKPDRHIKVNTARDLDDIKRERYPEALAASYHGIEYCLDDRSSMSKDSKLTLLQSSVIKYETLSSYVETDSTQSTGRCTRAVTKARNVRKETRPKLNATITAPDEKRSGTRPTALARFPTDPRATLRNLRYDPLNRPLKRKSPVVKKATVAVKRKRETPVEEVSTEQCKDDKESRSERHKRRLRQVVQTTIKDNGIEADHASYERCTERLYTLCKSFLKDLRSSHGLNDEMKRLANSNVLQVIDFETKKVKRKQSET